MKNYSIKFSYDNSDYGRSFYSTELKAENRQRAFDLAIAEFNSSIRLEQAAEDGKSYYYNNDF